MSAPSHALGAPTGLALARVTGTEDPQRRGRIRMKLLAVELEVWAGLVVPSAGQGYGVALLPKEGEILVVGFLGGEVPVVLGALWAGDDSLPPQAPPGQQRYSLTTPAGTVLLMDDQDGPRLEITTPAGHSLSVTDAGGGEVKAKVGATSLSLTPDAVRVTAAAELTLEAPKITLSAATVTIDAAMTKASGVVKCDTLIATSVVGSSYTPGAGNIW